MQVSLSKYAGFCGGVNRAYEMVRDMASDSKIKKPIFVLGSLVHNQDVVDDIGKKGVKKVDIKNRDLKEVIDEIKNEAGTLVITAHGMGPLIHELAKERNIDLIDTTCPKVIKAQKLAQVFKKRGYKIVIVGERDHKEVKGINEWIDESSYFIETEEDLSKLEFDTDERIFVLSQTTQNQDFVEHAYEVLKNRYKNAKVIDTVCSSTHNRQVEVRELAGKNDLMVIIGSPESANSNRLWEISKENNSNSYFVERLSDIDLNWFENKKTVGVSAGASTPPWIIEEIVNKLKQL